MKSTDIENIWSNARKSSEEKIRMTREEIDGFRLSRSGQIFGFIKKSIWMSLVMNFIFFVLLAYYLFFLNKQDSMVITLAAIIVADLLIMIYQWVSKNRVRGLESFTGTISSRFERLRDFFRVQFPVLLVINSLSNPLLVTTGVFYYQYVKYSEIKFSDTDDILVMAVLIVLSFIISYAGNRLGSANVAREVDDMLAEEIYDDDYFSMVLKREQHLRRKKIIITSVIGFIGLILLATLIAVNCSGFTFR